MPLGFLIRALARIRVINNLFFDNFSKSYVGKQTSVLVKSEHF